MTEQNDRDPRDERFNALKDENGFNVTTCGGPIDSHVGYVLAHTAQGSDCVDTYRALLEVAEAYRVRRNFPVYTPVMTTALIEQWKDAEVLAANIQEAALLKRLTEAKDLPVA